MLRKDVIAVMGDMENFLDRLLAHTEEDNCTHSVNDFLQEYFDNKDKKNGRRELLPEFANTNANSTTTTSKAADNLY